MSSLSADDVAFLVICLKHAPKLTPDYKAVAAEAGKKDVQAARWSLWNIMRKMGVNQSGKTAEDGKDPKTPTSNKRGRPAKAKGTDTTVEGNGDAGADETPSKKTKIDGETKEDAVEATEAEGLKET